MIFENGEDSEGSQDKLKKIEKDAGLKSRLFRNGMMKNLGNLLDLPLRHFFSQFSPGYSKLFRNKYIIRS